MVAGGALTIVLYAYNTILAGKNMATHVLLRQLTRRGGCQKARIKITQESIEAGEV